MERCEAEKHKAISYGNYSGNGGGKKPFFFF